MDRAEKIEARTNRENENRDRRRGREEDAAIARLDRQMEAADALIGQLCREGKMVLYINIKNARGIPTGKIKTGSRYDLIDYMIRNRYV